MTQPPIATVIGAGIMGPGIAQVLAGHGCEVRLCDLSPAALETARGTLATNLDLMRELGLIGAAEAEALTGRITMSSDIEGSLGGAGLVIEAVTESVPVKTEVLALIARAAPADALVWSNTSTLDVFSVAPEPLQDRLLRALGREAFYLMDGGYITAENLDLAVRASLAARMMVLGVVQRYDFTGLDLSARNLANADFVDAPVDLAPRSLLDHVARGELGVRSGKGFYDYEGQSLHKASRQRDRALWKLMTSCGEMTTAKRVV